MVDVQKIYAVIVSYNPDIELLSNLTKTSKQVDKVLLFDNNSNADGLVLVKECECIDNVEVIYSEANIGLSKAQNVAIKMALSEGADWILTLDDDSDISDDFVNNMLSLNLESRCDIGVIVPTVIDQNSDQVSRFILSGHKFRKVTPLDKPLEVLVAISSGMLIHKNTFESVGFMNEDYFIDYIDIDFSLRVNERFKILSSPKSILQHKLGLKEKVTVLGVSFIVSNHSPFRRYHIYRNRIDLWKRHFKKFPKYVLYEICVSAIEAVRILLLEKNRKDNFVSICHGIVSSFRKETSK
ncbi:glycosyltransferase [Vibrio scophthalmi]|uniref:glycosyltransferase n=1 Tax=Vibrio scophthalmi TaxID=45658 RepID=UPI002284507C|nr:glycosyltransferase [Vibrio scophthalmi]MCY9804039.1 glycosyltransferase [Vibrio scophthalmi]